MSKINFNPKEHIILDSTGLVASIEDGVAESLNKLEDTLKELLAEQDQIRASIKEFMEKNKITELACGDKFYKLSFTKRKIILDEEQASEYLIYKPAVDSKKVTQYLKDNKQVPSGIGISETTSLRYK